MDSILNLKTGRGVLNRLKAIRETPLFERPSKYGRGWPWEITNGRERIREEFPELLDEMNEIFERTSIKKSDDLEVIS